MLTKYVIDDSIITFCKTKDPFGGLSNMAAGYPITIGDMTYRTSEALYQACKFLNYPEIRRRIVNERSPIAAKMCSRANADLVRLDWNAIKIPVMRWCLEMKLHHNMVKFGDLLLSTGTKTIVEYSRNDLFWGAVLYVPGVLQGSNILGKLLMDLRVILNTGTFISPDPINYIPAGPIQK